MEARLEIPEELPTMENWVRARDQAVPLEPAEAAPDIPVSETQPVPLAPVQPLPFPGEGDDQQDEISVSETLDINKIEPNAIKA